MDPRRHNFSTREELAEALAEAVAHRLAEALDRRGSAFLAVSGGSTPARFFAALTRRDIDWENVTVTLVDERFVPPSSPRSNAALVAGNLLTGNAARARFVPLYQEAGSVEEASAIAGDVLRQLPWPLDAAVLGMGGDGHTASFFPDALNLSALIDPASTRELLPVHAQSAGEPRLTLTMARIAEAGFLALHIEGADKEATLQRALGGEDLPIRAVIEAALRPVDIYWAP